MPTPTNALIQTLNSVDGKGLTPDQIVDKINGQSWIKGQNMTREQFDRLARGTENGRVRLTEYQGYGDQLWWEGGVSPETRYRIGDWSLVIINDTLRNYYFIGYEDYRDGCFPPVPADAAYRADT